MLGGFGDSKLFLVHPFKSSLVNTRAVVNGHAHIRTSSSKISGCSLVLSAQILAIAEPQLPEPTTVTLCFFSCCPRVAMTAEEVDLAAEKIGSLVDADAAKD